MYAVQGSKSIGGFLGVNLAAFQPKGHWFNSSHYPCGPLPSSVSLRKEVKIWNIKKKGVKPVIPSIAFGEHVLNRLSFSRHSKEHLIKNYFIEFCQKPRIPKYKTENLRITSMLFNGTVRYYFSMPGICLRMPLDETKLHTTSSMNTKLPVTLFQLFLNFA